MATAKLNSKFRRGIKCAEFSCVFSTAKHPAHGTASSAAAERPYADLRLSRLRKAIPDRPEISRGAKPGARGAAFKDPHRAAACCRLPGGQGHSRLRAETISGGRAGDGDGEVLRLDEPSGGDQRERDCAGRGKDEWPNAGAR